MKVDQITVGERHRKEMGDLAELAESIDKHGLLHPLVVDFEGHLICGARRLEAVKELLGWDEVDVKRVNLADPLGAEHDENVIRKDFLPSEKVAITDELLEREKEAAKERQREGGRTKASLTVQEASKGEATERVAPMVGWSANTLRRARGVVKSGDQALIDEMDTTGKIFPAWDKLPARPPKPKPEPVPIGMSKRTGLTARARLTKVAYALAGYADALPDMHLRGESVDDVLVDIATQAGRIRRAANGLRAGREESA